MITVRLKGGLGNQLFQYSAAYALSKRLNQKMIMDTSFFSKQSLRQFNLLNFNLDFTDYKDDNPIIIKLFNDNKVNFILRKINYQVIKLSNDYFYCNETKSRVNEWFFSIKPKDVFINGYFQSEQYFKDCRAELVRQFTPSYNHTGEYLRYSNMIGRTNSVGVHVRRGDFLHAQYNYNPHHYLLTIDYYRKALKYIDGKIDEPVFYYFSDDIEWVKQNFGEQDNCHFINLNTNNSDIDELMLMKECKHIIVANSTFSWWAAWLNDNKDKIIICPSKRYGNESMIPIDWIKMDF